MLDKEAIREAADILVVAEEIGIPIQMSGKKPKIICPCHDDQHFGSCYLDTERKTFRCYSCGAKGDIFALVQAALNISFPEAKAVIAETCGGAAQFEMSGEAIERSYQYSGMMLPKADQDFLGIHNDVIYTDTAFYEELSDVDDEQQNCTIPEYDVEERILGYRVQQRVMTNPLYSLMRENETQYRLLIDVFCQRKIDQLRELINVFQDKPSKQTELCKAVYAILKYASLTEAINELTSLIKRVQNISAKFGNGAVISIEVSPYMEQLSAIANDIWLQDKEAPF